MISLIHLLSIKARPLPPLSQEQGSIDTETVATTRFAALVPVYSSVNGKINPGEHLLAKGIHKKYCVGSSALIAMRGRASGAMHSQAEPGNENQV